MYSAIARLGGGEAWLLHAVWLPLGLACLGFQLLIVTPATLFELLWHDEPSSLTTWLTVATLSAGMNFGILCVCMAA